MNTTYKIDFFSLAIRMIDESEDAASLKLQGKMFSTTISDRRKIVENQDSSLE